jgi:hypothetical protein
MKRPIMMVLAVESPMKRPVKDRAVRLAIVAACTALLTAMAATPAAAQQGAERAARSHATVDASAPEATSPSTPLPGPRLRSEWPRVEPAFAEHHDAAEPMAPAGNKHTIVLSTLALVVIVVIATILVVK